MASALNASSADICVLDELRSNKEALLIGKVLHPSFRPIFNCYSGVTKSNHFLVAPGEPGQVGNHLLWGLHQRPENWMILQWFEMIMNSVGERSECACKQQSWDVLRPLLTTVPPAPCFGLSSLFQQAASRLCQLRRCPPAHGTARHSHSSSHSNSHLHSLYWNFNGYIFSIFNPAAVQPAVLVEAQLLWGQWGLLKFQPWCKFDGKGFSSDQHVSYVICYSAHNGLHHIFHYCFLFVCVYKCHFHQHIKSITAQFPTWAEIAWHLN